MNVTNPFIEMVSRYAALLETFAGSAGEGPVVPHSFPPAAVPRRGRTTAVLFSPHPDDECITGALPLRLLREAGVRIVNVPVTLGSDRARRPGRLRELDRACGHLGFELLPAPQGGLERIHPSCRTSAAPAWSEAVDSILAILDQQQPDLVFLPHPADGHPTHAGTSLLVRDALAAHVDRTPALVVETEYWATMAQPNLMVAIRTADLADLVAALSLHTGEVARTPYHLRLPAWMIDNVRRGAELIGGHGTSAPSFAFATLYRALRREGGELHPVASGKVLANDGDPDRWLAELLAIPAAAPAPR